MTSGGETDMTDAVSASAEQVRADLERLRLDLMHSEQRHAMTQTALTQAEADRDEYRDLVEWWAREQEAGGDPALAVARWLHAEVVWQWGEERDELQRCLDRWVDQNTRLAQQRDEARQVVKQVNNNCADFAEALGLSRDAYGDEIVAAARELRESRFRWAEEAAQLQAKLDQPCGSCHPCSNYADQTWRAAGRKPPHVHQWDEASALLQAYRAREDHEVVFPQFWYDQVTDTAHASDRQAALRELLASWRPTAVEAAPRPAMPRRQCCWYGDSDRRCPDYGVEDSDYCKHHTTLRIQRYGTQFARWESYGSDGLDEDASAAPLAGLPEAEFREFHDAACCTCPGSGSLAHVRGCRLHPEATDAQ